MVVVIIIMNFNCLNAYITNNADVVATILVSLFRYVQMNVWASYGIAFIAVIATSLLGQYFTYKSTKSEWYKCIKPSITPPPIVFPIVWSVLYLCIAVAFAESIKADDMQMVMLFTINLFLNVVWCFLYFYKKDLVTSLACIILLVASTLVIIYRSKRNMIRGLLTPYILWLSFATILNALSIIKMKKCKEIQ